MIRLLPLALVGCFVTRTELENALDRDGDGFLPIQAGGDDCDETRPDVNPGAEELCGDGIDNDCDGVPDDDGLGARVWYLDDDDDGFGIEDASVTACTEPEGYASVFGDCDDTDRAINPGVSDRCDGVDDDCDGIADDDDVLTERYRDADGDLVGTDTEIIVACTDVPGFVSISGDCDDTDPEISPLALDFCDGVDQDCDGVVDDDAIFNVYYADADGDGAGDVHSTEVACQQPSGFVQDALDCNDADPTIRPGSADPCDGIDQDCDGVPDDGGVFASWYQDADGDGLGDTDVRIETCDGPLPGFVGLGGDCAPQDASVTLLTWFEDADADGFGGSSFTFACEPPPGHVGLDGDCDDTDPTAAPGETEICRTGVDEDCDPATDCRLAGLLEPADADVVVALPSQYPQVQLVEDIVGSSDADMLLFDVNGPGALYAGPVFDIASPAATLADAAACVESAVLDVDADGDRDLVCGGPATVVVFTAESTVFARSMIVSAPGPAIAAAAEGPLGPGVWKGQEEAVLRFFAYRTGTFDESEADGLLATGGVPIVLPSCPGSATSCLAVQDSDALRVYSGVGDGAFDSSMALATIPLDVAVVGDARLHLDAVQPGWSSLVYPDGMQLRAMDYTTPSLVVQELTTPDWGRTSRLDPLGDLDGDGFIDWNRRSGAASGVDSLFYGGPDGLPVDADAVISAEVLSRSGDLDWNGDGYPDLLARGDGELLVFFGSGI